MNSSGADADFVFVLLASAIGFLCYSALLVVKYRKSVVLCTFLLVPLMLFLVVQEFARMDIVTLTSLAVLAALSCVEFDHYLRRRSRAALSDSTRYVADFLWALLPAVALPPLLVAGLRQPVSAEIVLPVAMLSGCAFYLANYGRRRLRREKRRHRPRAWHFQFGLRGLVLGGPVGLALYTSGIVGGTLVYFSGATLFYGGLIQLPSNERDVWSSRKERAEARTRLGLIAVLFGLALMLVGVVNVIASA